MTRGGNLETTFRKEKCLIKLICADYFQLQISYRFKHPFIGFKQFNIVANFNDGLAVLEILD